MMHYEIRHSLLQEWSPELAYFLGIVITDGWVQENAGVFIDLGVGDKEVLEHIRDWISPTRPINGPYENKDGTFNRLALTSQLLAQTMMGQYGIMPRKTGEESIEFSIPDEFLPHFFRGAFDGDGFVTLRFRKNGNRNWEVGFVSASKKLLEQMNALYGGNKGRKIRVKTDSRKTKSGGDRCDMYAWEFGLKEGRKLRDWMYQPGHFAMARKRDLLARF